MDRAGSPRLSPITVLCRCLCHHRVCHPGVCLRSVPGEVPAVPGHVTQLVAHQPAPRGKGTSAQRQAAHAHNGRCRISSSASPCSFGSCSLPRYPYLILGPGAAYLHHSPFQFAPVVAWFYWAIVGLNAIQLTWQGYNLLADKWRTKHPLHNWPPRLSVSPPPPF